TIILFTGISSPRVFKKHLQTKANNVISIFYPDHHEYTLVEINKLVEVFKGVKGENKIILTTEKDAMRLDKKGIVEILDKLPIYYIPIEMTFDEHEKKIFDDFVIEFIHRLNKQHKLVR
ncbi:MAG TPA: tetraacyldisaccharide 4'-kinase, partial [Bacteroidia bacterium]|nr:tetraacyldisaccharide 4'-kinase [Bacteroidia bacterium]